MATSTVPKNVQYVDIEVTLTTDNLRSISNSVFNGRKMLSVCPKYSDDLYYATITDGRELTFSVGDGGFNVLQHGGTRTTNRNIIVRVCFE